MPTTRMLNFALDLLRSDPTKVRTLVELQKFAGIKMRSRGRLATQLADCPEVERVDGGWRYVTLVEGMDAEMRKLGF